MPVHGLLKSGTFALAFGTAFTAAPLTPTTPASATTGTHDGSSSDKAAASCYEVKQVNPSASSGTYWLYTPQMSGRHSSTAIRKLMAAAGS